ncbi:MAG: hypothetical protein WCJ92_05945 [Alphaproteobacteria bacterium]|jgi:hypothetical protein
MKIFKMMFVNAALKIALCFLAVIVTKNPIAADPWLIDVEFGNTAQYEGYIPRGTNIICNGTGTITFAGYRFAPAPTHFSIQVLLAAGFAQDLTHRVIAAPRIFWMVHRDDFLRDSIFTTEIKPQMRDSA